MLTMSFVSSVRTNVPRCSTLTILKSFCAASLLYTYTIACHCSKVCVRFAMLLSVNFSHDCTRRDCASWDTFRQPLYSFPNEIDDWKNHRFANRTLWKTHGRFALIFHQIMSNYHQPVKSRENSKIVFFKIQLIPEVLFAINCDKIFTIFLTKANISTRSIGTFSLPHLIAEKMKCWKKHWTFTKILLCTWLEFEVSTDRTGSRKKRSPLVVCWRTAR